MAYKNAKKVAGIPLHYARTAAHPYGTRGVNRTFRMKRSFYNALTNCFEELFAACPLGKPEVITSAGAFVNKPGRHGQGKAFDLDGLFWRERTLMTDTFPTNVELYLGIESYMRRHFGIVLNYSYNRAHEDHWHIDDSVSTSYSTRSRSKVLYLQLTLKHIYGLNVVADGISGPQTRGAYAKASAMLGLDGSTRKSVWLEYLRLTGDVAFALFERKDSPVALLSDVRELILNQPAVQRWSLLEALNSFEEHPETVRWLDGLGDGNGDLAAIIKEVRG